MQNLPKSAHKFGLNVRKYFATSVGLQCSTIMFLALVISSCQQAEFQMNRTSPTTATKKLNNADSAKETIVNIGLGNSLPSLGLVPVDFANVSGSVNCAATQVDFTGSPIVVSAAQINEGGCSIAIASFVYNGATYSLSETDPTAANLWTPYSNHRFLAGNIEVYMQVTLTIPAQLVAGEAYQFHADLIGNEIRNIAAIIQQAEQGLDVGAAIEFGEAPALELVKAEGAGVLKLSFVCDENYNAADRECEGKSLLDELSLYFSTVDLGLNAADAALLNYNNGFSIRDLIIEGTTETARDIYALSVNAEGEYISRDISVGVVFNEVGFELSIENLPPTSDLQLFAQWFDPAAYVLYSPLTFNVSRNAGVANGQGGGEEGEGEGEGEIFELPAPTVETVCAEEIAADPGAEWTLEDGECVGMYIDIWE